MQLIDTVQNEEARLNALRDLKLLDTAPSESFDRLTRLASQLLAAPVSTISLTDSDRQWFKSRVGVDLAEIPREQAPCSYAIKGNGVFVVPDLAADARFANSPLAQAGIRFYAGAPLFTRSGHGLGTLCVVDVKPREIGDEEQRVLKDLAGMVMSQIDLQNMIGRVDASTGRPNQTQFFEDVEERRQRQPDAPISTVLVEFASADRVQQNLRVLGPHWVDAFAADAMDAVQPVLGNSAKLYHVGPMRCAVLLGESETTDVSRLIDALSGVLAEPITCEGIPLAPDPTFGAYTFIGAEVAPRDALRRLVAACDDARVAQIPAASYDAAHDEQHRRSFGLISDFASALRTDDELSLVYQPRLAFASGQVAGVEALLRWTHPRLGGVSPGEFVPLIERTALARPMTDWVARQALTQARKWRNSGLDMTISINASALNLDERDFAGRLLRAVDDSGLDTRSLELEFTESAVAKDATRVIEQLNELKQQGIEIAIDDFGTGYSNLAYIQQLPVSILKIDRSFVSQLPTSKRDRTLVRTLITMAHELGFRVVAEGIETEETYKILAEYGCDEAQGYLISKPLPAVSLTDWHANYGKFARAGHAIAA